MMMATYNVIVLSPVETTKQGSHYKLPCVKDYDAFTLHYTEIDTDTDKLTQNPNGNVCLCLSLCSMNTSTQFYTTHFLSVSVSVSVSGSVNTPLNLAPGPISISRAPWGTVTLDFLFYGKFRPWADSNWTSGLTQNALHLYNSPLHTLPTWFPSTMNT